MKRTLVPAVVVILLLVLIAGGYFTVRYVERYMPTKEHADVREVLDVSGEETAFFYNGERLTDVDVITRDGQAYLPLNWVNENLNEKFYWDNVEKMLIYTLPDTIVYADKRTEGNGGKPLLLAEDKGIFLSVSLLASYTDIRSELFTEEANRLYLFDLWGEQTMGTAGKAAPVRVRGGIKSPILTTVAKGGGFTVLVSGEEWSKVLTDDGFAGWIQNKQIAETHTEVPVSTFAEPEYTSLSMDEKVCLVWHQVLKEDDNENLDQLIARTKGVNVIAPTWIMLTDNDGNYSSYASQAYVDRAHELGLQVWAVVDNFNKGDGVDSAVLFAKTSARKALIGRLMADVKSYGLDGINLDIEGISQEAMPHYVQFIRELSVDCRREGIFLSVDDYVPSDYTKDYNRAEQGRVADYVIIMGYDEHYAGGEPGSVASLPFVEGGITDTLAEVPKEKLINAVPFYTRLWATEEGKTTSTAMGLAAAQEWVEENGVELYWQEELGQYYGELKTETSMQQVWMEDERSLELKMGLIDRYDLAGVACWKLGLDSEPVWDIIKVNE